MADKLLGLEGLEYYHSKIQKELKTITNNVDTQIGDITDGTTTVGNADKLDGKDADYFETEIGEKVESEPALDFGEAKAPEFQENIDSLNDKVDELKSDLSELNETFDDNIENGFGIDLGNITRNATWETGYYNSDNGVLASLSNENYRRTIIPIRKNVYLTANAEMRYCILLADDMQTVIGEALQYKTQIQNENASYLAISVSVNNIDDFAISEGIFVSNENEYRLGWLSCVPQQPIEQSARISGNIDTNSYLEIAEAHTTRKGDRIVFSCDLPADFNGTVTLKNVSTSDASTMFYVSVDKTNLNINGTTYEHGKELKNNLLIIIEQGNIYDCRVTMVTNGTRFTQEQSGYNTLGSVHLRALSTVSLSNCVLSWTNADLKKDIWIFGDSYLSYNEGMWSYYLNLLDYDNNCLMNSYGGEDSSSAITELCTLLKYGRPKTIVWAMGMNDGSDTDTPSTTWATGRDKVISACKKYGIELIFITIPTVPTRNHEKKYEWVKASGYRYIDCYKALGASSDGTWFDDLQASDGVHTSWKGAQTYMARVLTDFPEIMIS